MDTDRYSRPASLVFFPLRRLRGQPLVVEVGGVLGVALVVGNQLDLDVERQGAKRAGEAVFLCGEGADVSHDVSPFGLNKVAVRPCCDPAGGMGWSHAQRSQQRGEPGSEKNLSREECAQRREIVFAARPSKAQPRHRQDSQQDKDAQAARSRMETWPTRHPRDGCTGLRPDAGQVNAPTTRPERLPQLTPHTEAWKLHRSEAGRRVGEPSFVTYRQRTASVGRHAFVQPAAASRA